MIQADAPTALSLLRILSGLWFLPHVIGKVRNRRVAFQTFERVGLKPGMAFLFLTATLEILAGIGLTFDLYPRVAAALAVVVLTGASVAVLRINGANWRWQKQGPEYLVFWALVCAVTAWAA